MRRTWSLLLLLLASSLMLTAMVHARELSGPVTVECTGFVHQDGDRDQTQGDQDKAVPHHHGSCQGPAMSMPATTALAVDIASVQALRLAFDDARLPSAHADPALRPPNA